MKIVGVIAEYNPFHNGHAYHLKKAKELTGADFCIAVMSGNFMQRGEPALIDKYSRTKMALLNGCDLVLELPVCYAVSSAENFAAGAIALLDRLGVVDAVCFGSECGDITALNSFAEILAKQPADYVEALLNHLKTGLSYPAARNAALLSTHKELAGYADVLNSPNNVLGIEYCKALLRRKSSITPVTIKRNGGEYNDTRMVSPQSSALSIRQSLEQKDNPLFIASQVPTTVFQILEEHFHVNYPIYPKDISLLLKYKLLQYQQKGYTEFLDVTDDFSDKILKNLEFYKTFEEFCDLLKSKDMTYTRISRCLLHILLDIKKEDLKLFTADDYVYYARILGIKQSSADILNAIKKRASIPLLSKLSDAEALLNDGAHPANAVRMLQNDIFAAHLYDSVATDKYLTNLPNEYRRQIVKVR